MSEPMHNWAGNITFDAARVHRPTSIDQARRIVSGAEAVRVLGTGHSFNRIADTEGDLIRVDGLPADVEIDSRAGTARVAAGMRLADVAARLDAAGFALGNLPSLPHISLAGACATGTHGSGDKNPGLAAAVRALRIVGPDGDLIDVAHGEADFPGAVVSLGALGVVTHMTVAVEPTFEIAQHVYRGAPIPAVIDHADDVFASAYSVSVFTDWLTDGSIWLKSRHPSADPKTQPRTQTDWLGGRLADRPQQPVPGMPPENCTAQLGVPGPWHERLPHFRPEFTPSSGRELQSEFFLPRDRAAEALAAVHALGPRIAPVVQISEVRTVAADDQWLSPAHGRDSMAVHFTWTDDLAAVAPVLAAVERELLPLGARPHWGKVFLGGPEAAKATYPKADDFRRLVDRCDPRGKFRNAFVRALFPVNK